MKNLTLEHIKQLKEICRQGKSGSLLLSIHNTVATLSFAQGEISYIFYRGKIGRQAIPFFSKDFKQFSGSIQFNFMDKINPRGDQPEVLTEFLFNALEKSEVGYDSAVEPLVAVSGDRLLSGVVLSADVKRVLERISNQVAGAQAPAICASAFAKTNSLRVAVDIMIRELDAEKASEFKIMLREAMAGLASAAVTNIEPVLHPEGDSTAQKTLRAGVPLDDRNRSILREILLDIVGPVADLLMNSEEIKSASSLRATIDYLIAQVPSPDTADQLKERIRQRLATG